MSKLKNIVLGLWLPVMIVVALVQKVWMVWRESRWYNDV